MERPTVLRVEDAAGMLLTSVDAVLEELASGRLRGFRVGGEWRTTAEAVVAFIEGGPSGLVSNEAEPVGSALPEPASAQEIDAYIPPSEWKSADAFQYRWPDGAERYPAAVAARVGLGKRRLPFVIGFTERQTAGRLRRRAVVFSGQPGKSLYPLVEFVGADDFESTHRMASLVKAGSKHVKPGQQLPAGYEAMPVVVYDEVVTGPYAAHSMAVEAVQEDHDVMVRHAILRAQAKGRF
jgi:hypothetical protein